MNKIYIKIKYLIFFILISWMNIYSQQERERDIDKYVDYLKNQTYSPVEYIFQLFEIYDIVVLGERDHRDLSQYELIKSIISDERFIKDIGNIFTEVGVCNRSAWANSILKKEYTTPSKFENDLRMLYRELDFNPIWEKYNFWDLLYYIHTVNDNLASKQKLNVYFTDVAFDWNTCKTSVDRIQFLDSIENNFLRDRIMGINFIDQYNKILLSDDEPRKKGLWILNTRHSYKEFIYKEDSVEKKLISAYSQAENHYHNKMANVMINNLKISPKDEIDLIQNGLWDAAFQINENKPIAFNFENSPFGEEEFDYYYKTPINNKKYKEIFTGFIFYKPIIKWDLVIGIPDIITPDFISEIIRREKIINPSRISQEEDIYHYYNNKRSIELEFETKEMINKKINIFIKNPEAEKGE